MKQTCFWTKYMCKYLNTQLQFLSNFNNSFLSLHRPMSLACCQNWFSVLTQFWFLSLYYDTLWIKTNRFEKASWYGTMLIQHLWMDFPLNVHVLFDSLHSARSVWLYESALLKRFPRRLLDLRYCWLFIYVSSLYTSQSVTFKCKSSLYTQLHARTH